MMGMQVAPAQLFYDFCLDDHVPGDHLLRRIDCFLDLESVRTALRPFYSSIGRPSVDPELMMRMLIVGYCMGLRSERRLCEEVHLNLAYRWFCRLGLDGKVPDHSTFSRNRHGRFRQSDILRHLFETVVERCLTEGLVGGEGFAVDASLIAADANKQRSIPGDEWRAQKHGTEASRADFVFDPDEDYYTCPGGKRLVQYRRNFTNRRSGVTKDGIRFYRAKQSDCQSCELKPRCCPNTLRRRIPRNQNEDARDVARALAGTPAFERSRHSRKKIEMLFAHLKRILRLARLRLRGPSGARDEFLLAATAQNLRRLAKLRPMPTFAGAGA